MSIYRNLITLCFAAVFTLGLAACGGGGDGAPPETTMPDPAPIDVERMAISDALDAAAAAAALVTDAATDEQVGAADMAVAAAMTAIADAALISAAEVTAANSQLAVIQGQLTAAKTSRTTAMNIASQRMTISDALAAATTAVGAVMDDSDDATVDAADAAVMAASAAIDAAGDILASEAAAERAKVAALQSDLDDAKASRTAAMQAIEDAERMAREAEARRTAQLAAISSAITAAGMDVAAVNDASNDATVTAAEDAIAAARGAIMVAADVAADELASYTATVDGLETTLNTAKESRQMAMAANQELANQRTSISTAIAAARTAVGAVNDDSTDAQVEAAETAIADARVAIAGAADVPAEEKAANTGTVDAIMANLNTAKASRMAAIEAAEEEAEAERKAMAANGKLLKGALRATPLGYAVTVTSLTGQGVVATMNHDQDDGTTPLVTSPRLAPGDSAGSLGDWNGTHYSHKNAGTGVSNSAIIYTNRAAAKSFPIASRYATGTNVPTNAGTYTPADRMLTLGEAADANIKADGFPTAGTTTFTPTAPSNENLVRGTYQGAAGTYRCIGTCTATAGANGVALSADWVFVHDTGAMVSIADPNYLAFGWWLTKNKDDEPTLASAFTHVQGSIQGDGTTALATNPGDATMSGKATYTGGAAGKFAISDPLSGGDAGHFTADATLNATFGNGATAGLSGTIDNFMANEEAVPWSVTLHRSGWDGTTFGATTPVDNASTATVDESVTQTVWSIDGNAAAASGTWSAQMYDELPGPMPTGDGSNVPTSVTGMFQSHFGSTHTMVGAFGATAE